MAQLHLKNIGQREFHYGNSAPDGKPPKPFRLKPGQSIQITDANRDMLKGIHKQFPSEVQVSEGSSKGLPFPESAEEKAAREKAEKEAAAKK